MLAEVQEASHKNIMFIILRCASLIAESDDRNMKIIFLTSHGVSFLNI